MAERGSSSRALAKSTSSEPSSMPSSTRWPSYGAGSSSRWWRLRGTAGCSSGALLAASPSSSSSNQPRSDGGGDMVGTSGGAVSDPDDTSRYWVAAVLG